jgi:hypothetical protein
MQRRSDAAPMTKHVDLFQQVLLLQKPNQRHQVTGASNR